MTGYRKQSLPEGCMITSISSPDCIGIIDGARSGKLPHAAPSGGAWLLAHCDDGVVWGRAEPGQDRLLLSTGVFAHVSPTIEVDRLQTLRLFSRMEEILIWKIDGGFLGRKVTDAHVGNDLLKPMQRSMFLLGTRVVDAKNGFSLLEGANGSRHAPPLTVKHLNRRGGAGRLCLVEYLARDEETGEVRIALSRLSSLEKGET